MDLTDCPGRAELERFVIGELSAPELARLSGHIEQCSHCERAVQGLDSFSDPLLSGLRRIARGKSAVLEPVPEPLLAKVRSRRFATGSSSWLSNESGSGTLGRFELLEQVGVGSFGYVFRARDTELGRLVAIKIPRAGHLASQEDAARFLREARSAAQLKHPGIVTIHETGQAEDGTFYLVEEFVQGTTLSARLRTGPLPFEQTAELIAAVCDALECAHTHGVIHRDIKPANILLDAEGRPHLMDFGLAKREAEETVMTQDGQVLGTPAYMSPEQARGESHRVDVRTDIYSTGVVAL